MFSAAYLAMLSVSGLPSNLIGITPVLPQCDLGIVLEALSKPPDEPLRQASLKHLTLKTVFLIGMGSAGSFSELIAAMASVN